MKIVLVLNDSALEGVVGGAVGGTGILIAQTGMRVEPGNGPLSTMSLLAPPAANPPRFVEVVSNGNA